MPQAIQSWFISFGCIPSIIHARRYIANVKTQKAGSVTDNTTGI
jgi:hypothetical protein